MPALIAFAGPLTIVWRWPFDRTEVASVSVAQRSIGGIFTVLRHTDAPLGMYYVLLHFWLWVGNGEGVVRLPSVAFGAAAVFVTALLGRKVYGAQVGFAAGLLMALSVFATKSAAEARPYALMMLLTVSATLVFLRAVEDPKRSTRFAYAVLAILAIFAQFFAGLVIAGHLVALLARRGRAWRLFVGVYEAIAAVTVPFVLFVVTQQSGEVGWIPATTVHGVVKTTMAITGGRLLTVGVGGLAVIGALQAWFARRREATRTLAEESSWPQLLVATGLFLPAPIIIAISFAKPLMVPRYFTETLPFVAMLAAAGLFALSRPGRKLVAAAMVIGLSLSALSHTLQQHFRLEDVRGAADTVADLSRPGDVVTFAPAYWRSTFEWYFAQLPVAERANVVDVAFKQDAAKAGTLYPTEVSASELAHLLDGRQRIWIVGDPPQHVTKTTTPEPMRAFESSAAFRHYHLAHLFVSGDLAVRLFVRNVGS